MEYYETMKYSELLFGDTGLDRAYVHWYTNPQLNGGDNAAFHEHMPVLRMLCAGKKVVELGSRFGVSTLAILSARPASLFTVDIQRRETIDYIEQLAAQENIPFKFVEDNDLTITIPQCDLLFIDTEHSYFQLSQELKMHGNKATQYIVMHDLISFGDKDEFPHDTEKTGLIVAMEEFLVENPHWKCQSYWFPCNGLVVLTRT
jgi:hypothetical protein